MEVTDSKSTQALQWLRYVLNPDTEVPEVSDWAAIYDFARKQALLGICIPQVRPESMPQLLLFEWIAQVQLIEQNNNLINKRIEQLFGMLEKDGFECCLLKGQGNARMYPNPLRRCPGDIDVWVNGTQEAVYQYVLDKFPGERVTFKHIHFPIFNDVPVDVHVTPLKLYSRTSCKRLERWIEQNKESQFQHQVTLPGVERTVSVPTDAFNAVYQLGHMMIHFFDEGLGLRQVVDYFYVLSCLDKAETQGVTDAISDMGMLRFAKAVMWVEHEVLGLPLSNCIVGPDEQLGRLILNDIVEGGNFGRHTQRYNGHRGFYYRGMAEAKRDLRLLKMAPRECVARLLSKSRTAVRYAVKKCKNK